jgi:Xaa-Pro aminopeptidase
MVKDGVALTRFFLWLEKNADQGNITEESAARKVAELRLLQTNCTGDSFAPIVAYNEHGALPHYSFADNQATTIIKNGVLLVDSGGQYLDGTTDITRCIALGEPSQEMRNDFTLALKGMIAVASACFPHGTRGSQLDILARKALWDRGINFGHGTGHGVGFFLNVHEGPPAISPSAGSKFNLPLEKGMVVSDEPGIYREGKYGFRTENLLLVEENIRSEFGLFLKFETLTLCYIDITLVERSLLDDSEISWLNSYHRMVFERLSNFLNEEERIWLKGKIREI